MTGKCSDFRSAANCVFQAEEVGSLRLIEEESTPRFFLQIGRSITRHSETDNKHCPKIAEAIAVIRQAPTKKHVPLPTTNRGRTPNTAEGVRCFTACPEMITDRSRQGGNLCFDSDSDLARQGDFIYIAHFTHRGNSMCFTLMKKLKKQLKEK